MRIKAVFRIFSGYAFFLFATRLSSVGANPSSIWFGISDASISFEGTFREH